MSVSLYNWTEACDCRPCCGDCDLCSYEEDEDDEPLHELQTETELPEAVLSAQGL